MKYTLAILRFLTSLHASIYDHESEAARAARLMTIAEAVDWSSAKATCEEDQPPECKPIFGDRRLLIGMLISKGKHESNFAAYVHEGRCNDGPVGARCDADRFGVARAHGPWQQWAVGVWPREDWEAMNSSSIESTKIAAWHATTALAGGMRQCSNLYPGDKVAGAIASYAGSCLRMRPAAVQTQAADARRIAGILQPERDAS